MYIYSCMHIYQLRTISGKRAASFQEQMSKLHITENPQRAQLEVFHEVCLFIHVLQFKDLVEISEGDFWPICNCILSSGRRNV